MSTQDFEFVARHRAHATPEYLCEIDEYRRGEDQFLLAHIRVFKWTPSAFKRLKREFAVFRTVMKLPLFACPEVADAKWVKFVTALGFKPHMQEVPCVNGDVRPLYIHTV